MTRYFMQSWKSHLCKKYAREGDEDELLSETSSAKFVAHEVSKGDHIYAVFVRDGRLFLIGKIQVGRIVFSRKEAADLIGSSNIYPGVRGAAYVIAELATRMHFSRSVPLHLVRRLRFVSDKNPRLKFVDDEKLDRQTLRNVRELTPKSAALLDEFLEEMERFVVETESD